MKTHRSIQREAVFAALGLALLTGACANYRPTQFKFKPTRSSAASGQTNGSSGTGNGSWGNGSSGSGSSGEFCNIGLEPELYDVEGIGYDGIIRFNFLVHSRFRVQFRAEQNTRQVAGTGFTPVYSVLGVYFKVWENEEATPLLPNGLYAEQRWSAPIDLSSSFPRICPNGDPACRQPVELKIEKPNTDYLFLGAGAHTVVQPGHPWKGSLRVETDDTNSLECE